MKVNQYHTFFAWAARIIAMLFALFLGIFAADVFNESNDFWSTTLSLGIHLIPSLIILLILWFAWKQEWVGGILYILLGFAYVIWSQGRFNWTVYLVIAGPMFLIGILFWLSWINHRKYHKG